MPKKSYRKVAGDEEANNDSRHPMTNANFLSILTFWWMNNVLKTGSERPLKRTDFLPLHEDDNTRVLTEKLQKKWNSEVQECNTKEGRKPKLWKSLLRMTSVKCICNVWFALLVESGCRILQPVLLGYLLYLLASLEENRSLALGCAALLSLNGLTSAVVHYAYHKCNLHGMRLTSAVRGLIYLKIPLVSQRCLQEFTTGRVIDLISNDLQRLESAPIRTMSCSLMLFEFPVVVFLMWYLIGWQSLMGVLFMAATVPYVSVVSSFSANLRKQTAEVTDRRISLMDELVSGIRVLKTGAWEGSYRDKITDMRRSEIWTMLKKRFLLSFVWCLYSTSAILATFVSTVALLRTGHDLTPTNAFMLLMFNHILRLIFSFRIGSSIPQLFELFVSLRRIEKFLLLKNLPSIKHEKGEQASRINDGPLQEESHFPTIFVKALSLKRNQNGQQEDISGEFNVIQRISDAKSNSQIGLSKENERALSVSCLTCKIKEPSEKYLLEDVTFEASEKCLTVITGQIGSGKSTLLSSIAGEVAVSSGSISYSGAMAYVSQTTWIFSGTLRENILFGEQYVANKYTNVIEACALREDIQRFPKGDLTFVGERGIVLSGGQRARVSLARAVYADADVYLLDDPLSAVDVKVGEHIFNQCICQLLHDKTIIMATHEKEYMKAADQVVVLQRGSVLGRGSFSELMDSELLDSVLDAEAYAPSDKESVYHKKQDQHKATDARLSPGDDAQELDIAEEDRATGKLSTMVYWDYFRAGFHPIVMLALIAFILAVEVETVFADVWFSHMTRLDGKHQRGTTTLGVYAGLVFGSLVLAIIRAFIFFHASLRSSKRLHDRMVDCVLQAPVLFYDTNPAGRILNRFSKDIGCIDEVLLDTFLIAMIHTLFLCAAVVLASVTNVWVIFVSIPVVIIFVYLAWYCLKTSRELRRLESICRSPVFSHFSETMSGLDTIRTRGRESDFVDQFYRHQDLHNQVYSMVLATARWFGFWADLLSSFFITAVAIACIVTSKDPALTGLVLAYAMQTTIQSQVAVRLCSEVENLMTSAERVVAYTKLTPEPGYNTTTLPPRDWPQEGSVSFRNVVMRYYPGGPQVLKNLSFDIQGKTKIGIVGRTGDGKSSIVAAVLRMPDAEGDVIVDGVNIKFIQLQESRRCVSVLTQTPVLFSGSLRKNLDPLENHSDDELWRALEDVQLKFLVKNLEKQLDYELSERGGNFSVGERQLICLARTLLQQSKIVILDEPTAHVDPNTERTIWNTVHEKLKDSTVITIAHRLNTIRDCEMILVVRDGEVAEFDTFDTLLGREGGVLYNMAASQSTL